MAKSKTSLSDEITLKKPYFNDVDGEQVVNLQLETLETFENHPFYVREDEKMVELVESIEKLGVTTPIIVREKGRGMYEIIAGHRRKKACELLELTSIPAFIRDLDDEEAILHMVDTNIQRDEILPSEKAYAYKMKLDALKKQGKRTDLTSHQVGEKSEQGKTSVEKISEDSGDSKIQIHRYIRLTHLIPHFLDLVDGKKLPFNVAVELSYLNHEEQDNVQKTMDNLKLIPSLDQSTRLKSCSKEGNLSQTVIESILTPSEEKVKRVSVKVESSKFFPENTPKAEMEKIITELLEQWKKKQ